MKTIRIFDIVFSIIGLLLLSPVFLTLLICGYLDTGSPLFVQQRVGRKKRPFKLVKFRSMRTKAKSVATHLADPADITVYGSFLRRSKLDELPQLWNVLIGDMSLVGPRPCLFNQQQLVLERDARGVFTSRPGITGLAQIQGIDMSTPALLAQTDSLMIEKLTLSMYFSLIMQTVRGKGTGDRITHSPHPTSTKSK